METEGVKKKKKNTAATCNCKERMKRRQALRSAGVDTVARCVYCCEGRKYRFKRSSLSLTLRIAKSPNR